MTDKIAQLVNDLARWMYSVISGERAEARFEISSRAILALSDGDYAAVRDVFRAMDMTLSSLAYDGLLTIHRSDDPKTGDLVIVLRAPRKSQPAAFVDLTDVIAKEIAHRMLDS